jgi:hypothetical protein
MRFNSGRWVERALNEGYRCCLRDRYLTGLPGEQNIVESLLIGWMDRAGQLEFYAHRFLRADASIAASGKLDPKLMFADGRWYMLRE